MKKLAYLSVLLIATACGGGGGGGGTDNTTPNPNPQPNPPTESQLVQQLLEGCGLSSTDEFNNLFDLLVGLFSPGAPAPAFQITSINILSTQFGWGIDLSSPPDAVNDLTGTIKIRDAANSPTLGGLDATALLGVLGGDLNSLPTLLASVDAGTRFVVSFNGAPPSNTANMTISGEITIVMGNAGAFDSSSGSFNSTLGADCTSTVSWTDLDISGVTAPGTLPTGTMTLVMNTAAESVNGTITLDGTSVVAIDASRNGGPTQSYTYDVGTGTLTPQ